MVNLRDDALEWRRFAREIQVRHDLLQDDLQKAVNLVQELAQLAVVLQPSVWMREKELKGDIRRLVHRVAARPLLVAPQMDVLLDCRESGSAVQMEANTHSGEAAGLGHSHVVAK